MNDTLYNITLTGSDVENGNPYDLSTNVAGVEVGYGRIATIGFYIGTDQGFRTT